MGWIKRDGIGAARLRRMAAVLLFGGAVLQAQFAATATAQETGSPLLEARKDFTTRIIREQRATDSLPPPPEALFSLVHFPAPIGDMAAYLGKAPKPVGKHPAIIWIVGGLPPGGMDESAWSPAPVDNDQSAKAYREAGIVMMYPTVRGSFGNPGLQETFYGEVDDIVAALAYLREVDYVDPDRIYLGGHSTGGTLALLVAAATPDFRAVFSFGPTSSPEKYGTDVLTYDFNDEMETLLRAPEFYVSDIASPTFVFEGSDGNTGSFEMLELFGRDNRNLRFIRVEGADHFSILAPVNRLIAERIAELGSGQSLAISAHEVERAFQAARESGN